MTAGAGARDLTMIEIRRFPGRHGMTGIASSAGSNVGG